ncbi:LysR family transcriptional regulator [Sabulicella rubraurantiaca]|uniref:LysR substrate-binding domain-containing protein n=1 Tax=Sabulicella rubraurantiaca TaxID=2811429 RepID=UPI001A95A72E|nr:LysR family transcriptional regulator [Sabulicella rubraurantiaca]
MMAERSDNPGPFDWDDLRVLLAVDEAGTLLGAGRALGVSHTTVLRRLAAAESNLAARLFRRQGGALVRTPAGEEVLGRARRIRSDIVALTRSARAADGSLSGSIRLAAPPGLATDVLIPRLGEFLHAYPRIRVALLTDLDFSGMLRGDADVGVRISSPLADRLDVRRICDCHFGLYAVPRLAAAAARALERGSPSRVRYVAFEEGFSAFPEDRWIRDLFGTVPPVLRANTTTALLSAAVAGLGVAALPRYMGDREPKLRLVATSHGGPVEGVFLVTRREQRGVARVRALVDYLARVLLTERELFAGRTEPKAAKLKHA